MNWVPLNVIYDGSHPNPTDKDVEAGVRIYNDNGCQAIIAFGGGSPMDCAKGIAAMASDEYPEIYPVLN